MGALSLRLRIFLSVFIVASVASLGYVFSRPAVYLSTARLQLEATPDSPELAAEALSLTSAPLLEKVAQRQGSLQPAALQEMLSAVPVPGSNLIELRAEGGDREMLPRVLATWIQVYRQGRVKPVAEPSTAASDELRATVRQLQENLAAKRRDVEEFRRKYEIGAAARDESQSSARLKALEGSLADARTQEAGAQARVNALREGIAAGRSARLVPESSTIAELQKRASDLREKMRALEQDYTPKYLAIDTGYKAMQVDLAKQEQQIEAEQRAAAARALQAAQADAAVAQQKVVDQQAEFATPRREAQEYSARVAEHAVLAKELVQLEDLYLAENARLAQLEAVPKAEGQEPPVTGQPSEPDLPVRPDYAGDALLAVGGSAVLGLLALWGVALSRRSGAPAVPSAEPAVAEPEVTMRLPRELSTAEIDALLAAAAPDVQPVIAALLGGRAPSNDAPQGADIDAQIADAARRARLANPAEVNAESLRFTFIAHQFRQRN